MFCRVLVLSILVLSFLISCKKDSTTDPLKPTPDSNCTNPVTIGTQTWMCKNLDVDHYRNGDPIPEVKDSAAWTNLTTGAWCYYDNDPKNGAIYGKLYNWYAVNDPRGLAPSGWHVPSDAEWKELEIFLGMTLSMADTISWRGTKEGSKLKEEGVTHWNPFNTGATNESGFTALPGGVRAAGNFGGLKDVGIFWTSSEHDTLNSWDRYLIHDLSTIFRYYGWKVNAFSVRCIKDSK